MPRKLPPQRWQVNINEAKPLPGTASRLSSTGTLTAARRSHTGGKEEEKAQVRKDVD